MKATLIHEILHGNAWCSNVPDFLCESTVLVTALHVCEMFCTVTKRCTHSPSSCVILSMLPPRFQAPGTKISQQQTHQRRAAAVAVPWVST